MGGFFYEHLQRLNVVFIPELIAYWIGMSEELLIGLASIIVLGILAQWLAWRLQHILFP